MLPAPSLRRLDHPADRLRLVIELLAVTWLGILPHLFNAVYPWFFATSEWGDSAGYSAGGIVSSLQVLLPLLYIMWRAGKPWRAFGVVPIHPPLDIVLGVLALIFTYAGGFLVERLASIGAAIVPLIGDALGMISARDDTPDPVGNAMNAASWALFIVWMFANAAAEEFLTKAYLIPRLRDLFGSTWPAIVVSSAAFASYHIYQGSFAVFIIFVTNVVLAWMFVKIRRIWPFILGHALYNISLYLLY